MEKEPYRFYIKTRTLLGIRATDIHQELTTVYGAQALCYSTVQKWSKFFREGNMQIEDEPRSGRPVTKATQENIDLVRRLIEEDPHSTYDDIEEQTELSSGTISRIIHDHLKLKKISSRWVPHDLTAEQKQLRVEFCRKNLRKLEEGAWRLCDIMTGDEIWIYLRQIGRKASNACWCGPGQSPGTVVRREKQEPKVLFSIFFRSSGPLLVHSLGAGVKLDHYYYIDNCLKAVVEVIRNQRPKSGTHGMKLLHDNAKAHDAQEVKDYLKQEGIGLVPHPPYSPDLSPCDYWLNSYIKQHLTDQTSPKKLHKAVTDVVFSIPIQEYQKTFHKLIERMQLCIKNKGNYFEHLVK